MLQLNGALGEAMLPVALTRFQVVEIYYFCYRYATIVMCNFAANVQNLEEIYGGTYSH